MIFLITYSTREVLAIHHYFDYLPYLKRFDKSSLLEVDLPPMNLYYMRVDEYKNAHARLVT
jgi:hypothetical protein